MNNRNEESERKSWESSKSDSYEQMPMQMPQMQNYNPCMCCPMMYGNVNMQGSQMMNKCGREGFRDEEGFRPYHGHGQGHGQHYGHGQHNYHPYYNYHPYPYFVPWNYGDWSE